MGHFNRLEIITEGKTCETHYCSEEKHKINGLVLTAMRGFNALFENFLARLSCKKSGKPVQNTRQLQLQHKNLLQAKTKPA